MNELTTMESAELSAAPISTSTANLVLNAENMKNALAFAEVMASGMATVPQHLRKNRGDCLAVTLQAMQWNMNPFPVAQKTHVVNGTLGYEAQLVIAVINNSGLLANRLNWEWFGPWEKIVGRFKTVESKTKKDDDGNFKKYIVPDWNQADEKGLGVRCFARMKGEDQPRIIELLMTQARTRNSTLWTEDPKQQLGYLAAKRWGRLHTPDVMLGVYTPDELQEIKPKDMGAADVVDNDTGEITRTTVQPTTYPQDKFDANLPSWKDVLSSGRKTHDVLIAWLESKHPLTDEQRKTLRACPGPQAATTTDAGEPATTE